MSFTLAQLAKLETSTLRKGVMMNLLNFSKAMEIVPWERVDSLKSIAVRWKTLPDVAFRRIHGGYTKSHGDYEQIWESVYALGGDMDFDRVFEHIKNTIVDPKVDQTTQKLKSVAYKFNDYLINGDHATDVDGFEGLKKRVANMPPRQSVYFAGAAAAPLDPTASSGNANIFLNKLEEGWYKCNGGQAGAIFCNEGLYWGLGRVLRYIGTQAGSMLDVTKDSFDRSILTYRGVPLLDIGFKKDQSTLIITDTEVAGDAGADSTSLYMVSFGTEKEGLTGIQLNDLAVYDPLAGGEMETLPATLLRIDWWLGLASFGDHAIVRLRNIERSSDWTY